MMDLNNIDTDEGLKLKIFVEQLLNDALKESEIKTQMKAFGFKYSSDPKVRWMILLDHLTNLSKTNI